MQLSIIIPCHNCSETLFRAVDSVFFQSFTDWELILVNNNSSDDTWEKMKWVQANNPEKNIIVLDEKKKGAPSARNKGLYEAKGEWIQFLDADDELLPDKIGNQIRHSHNADLIIGGAVLQKSNGSRENRPMQKDQWIGLISSELGITSSNLFRKEDLVKINGWDESLSSSQEYDLMFRMLKNGATCYFTNEINAIIYENENSISRDQSAKKIQQIVGNRLNLRFSIYRYLKKKDLLSDAYQKAIKESVMNNLLYYGHQIPLFAWKIFLGKLSLLRPSAKDFKHMIAITLFYKK